MRALLSDHVKTPEGGKVDWLTVTSRNHRESSSNQNYCLQLWAPFTTEIGFVCGSERAPRFRMVKAEVGIRYAGEESKREKGGATHL